ncbi:MAG: precorrin-6y C5,15-methyltransferase (decarboxylating) subunit CbiE [Vulcanimicrobiaceae bacterium]
MPAAEAYAPGTTAWLALVGIGEDGYAGLGERARAAIAEAALVVGSARQLALLPPSPRAREAWPVPLVPFFERLLERERTGPLVILASGDPMSYGIGALVAKRLPVAAYRVFPQAPAYVLACARLGWSSSDVTLVSAVTRPVELIGAHVQPGRRLVVYSENGDTPVAVAATLVERGYGPSSMTVFDYLGGARERRRDGTAERWGIAPAGALNCVAIACVAAAGTELLPSVPGLPDRAYLSDGQLTKRDVRASTLARLVPLQGQLLWDVGAGSGSVGIEWMRVHPSLRAVAFECDDVRVERIAANALRLGVPGLRVVHARAPDLFADERDTPDAIFIGGGLTTEGLVAACMARLRPGGRLVANAVTVEGEALLAAARARYGGDLVRLSIAHAEPVGDLLGWRTAMPITQWSLRC